LPSSGRILVYITGKFISPRGLTFTNVKYSDYIKIIFPKSGIILRLIIFKTDVLIPFYVYRKRSKFKTR